MAAVAGMGVPIVYYVTPQVWAWRPGRMKTHAAPRRRWPCRSSRSKSRSTRRPAIPVRFLGHPLVDAVPAPPADRVAAAALQAASRAALGLDAARPTVALLPGSRHNEIARLAPVMAAALPLVAARVPELQAWSPARRATRTTSSPRSPPRPRRHAWCAAASTTCSPSADVVVTASGTATAETALHERPMVVVYKLSPLTYRLGKPLVTIDTYAMANLVAGEHIVPELMQDACTPEAVAGETDRALHRSRSLGTDAGPAGRDPRQARAAGIDGARRRRRARRRRVRPGSPPSRIRRRR